MSVDSSRTTGKIKKLISFGLEPEVFNFQHEWVKNGPQGVAHASTKCYKYSPSYSRNTIKVTTTPLLVKRACVDCFNEAFSPEVVSNINVASKLIKKMEYLELEKVHSARTSAALLLKTQSIINSLKLLAEKENFESFCNKLSAKLKTEIAKLEILAVDADSEMRKFACSEYYQSINNDRAPKVEKLEDKVLGFSNTSYVSLHLFNEFKILFVKGCDEQTITQELLTQVKRFKLRDTDQLDFTWNQIIDAESNLKNTLETIWQNRVNEITTKLASLWYFDCVELLNTPGQALVAISDISDLTDPLTAVVSTYQIAVVKKTATLLVPEIVTLWVQKCAEFGYNVKVNVVRDVSKSKFYPEILERGPEINQAALALWEPFYGQVYSNYTDALKAALKL